MTQMAKTKDMSRRKTAGAGAGVGEAGEAGEALQVLEVEGKFVDGARLMHR